MPTTGEITGHKGMDAYKSAYSHDSEIVKPGYHKVELDKYKIGVELTSTARVGMHRYTYPAGEKANVLFDVGALLAHGKTEKAAIHRISSKEIGGYSVLAPTSRRQEAGDCVFRSTIQSEYDRVRWLGKGRGGQETGAQELD